MCNLALAPSGNLDKYVNLSLGKHIYSGNKELTQYFIRWPNTHLVLALPYKGHIDGDGQRQQFIECQGMLQLFEIFLSAVKVVMGRRLLGVFMTVYMPTILMNLIGHSTNYFSEMYFEATISVNLTASTF